MLEYSIIIPARNESARIASTLEKYIASFDKSLQGKYEILVVVNGCSDNTFQIVSKIAEKRAQVIAWECKEGYGKGLAIKEGMKRINGNIAAFCDADGSTGPEDIIFLLKETSASCDVAIGSRWLDPTKITVHQPIYRKIAGRIFNIIVRILFGFNIKDTQCGCKAFKKAPCNVIINTVKNNGYIFDVEALWHLTKAGYKIKEVPISWHDERGSNISLPRDGFIMLIDLIKLRLGISAI